MMKIRTLSGASYDAMERAMFLNQMPLAVRTALASSKAASNDELSAEADAIYEEFRIGQTMTGTPHAVAALQAPLEVDAVPRRPDGAQRISRRQDPLCYIHRKYGAQAFYCKSTSCPMRNQIAAPPAPGNPRAGLQYSLSLIHI